MKHGVLKKLLLATWLIMHGLFAMAQQDSMMRKIKTLNKPVFHAIANAGLIAGASDRDLQLQAITGVGYQTWLAGVGAGLDYYYVRSVPLFIEVRKQFKKSMPLFAYADAGVNFPWVENKEEMQAWGYKSDFKSGLYYDFGAGWHYEIGKRNKLLFSVGYAGKKIREVQTTTFNNTITKLEYNLRRISIKVGFQF
jgi:hypothetical protein